MERAYFQYYETFETVVRKFETAEEREHLREAIINYGFYGAEPKDLNDREELVWDFLKELIDDQKHRREVNRANRETRKKAKQQSIQDQSETSNLQDEESQPAQKKKSFVKPTPEQVQEYCNERKNGITGQQFCDFYDSKGWKVGNAPMKDWKAAVRNWETRERSGGPPRRTSRQRQEVEKLTF